MDKEQPDLEGYFYTDIRGCARCGGEHRHTLVKKFINPPPEYKFYANCPKWNEPILVDVTQTK